MQVLKEELAIIFFQECTKIQACKRDAKEVIIFLKMKKIFNIQYNSLQYAVK